MLATRCLGVCLALLILPSALWADRTSWDALPDPAALAYEDPFLELGTDDLYGLVTVARLRDRLEKGVENAEVRERIEARLAENETALRDAGIDVEWLISQRWIVAERREAAARKINPLLANKAATLTGFLIPAPKAEDGSHYAYLVPILGQCSHSPPPPPNQLVRLRMAQDFGVNELYAPVEVAGTLRAEASAIPLHVLDGMVTMDSSWTLDTDSISSLSTLGVLYAD